MSYAHLLHTARELTDKGYTPEVIYPVVKKGQLETLIPLANALGIKITLVKEQSVEYRVKRNSKYNSTTAGITLAGLANHKNGISVMPLTDTKGVLMFPFYED